MEEFLEMTSLSDKIIVPTFEVFTSEPSDIEFIEGNRKRVEHFRVERSGLLKKYYKKVNPNPICCACGADMSKRYPWTDYMLDIHHLLPLSSAVAISSSGTSLADIVGLCPSCHRAVHMYYRKWLRANEQADFKSKQEAHDVFVQSKREELARILIEHGITENFPGVFHGGPPCQSFSIAANQRFSKDDNNFKRKGFDDEEKGTLIFDYIWFIEKFRPVAFLIENVAGIMECDNDGRIKKALDDLASDGYTITEPRVLNAANYGVPQNRMRWIVAGTRKNTKIILPEPTATVTPCGSVFLRSTENAKNHVTRKHTAESICRYMKLPYGGRDKLGRVDRLDPRLPSKTVIAGGTKGGGRSHLHPFVPRTLSVRECARLQTFPDDYIFTGANARQFTQVGNAVPPLLAYKLALAIKHSVFLLPQKEELSTE